MLVLILFSQGLCEGDELVAFGSVSADNFSHFSGVSVREESKGVTEREEWANEGN